MSDLGSGERFFIGWALDYSMDWTIRVFQAIPETDTWVRPAPGIVAPGWTFGHIAVTERVHIGRFCQGIDDIPANYNIFYPRDPQEITETQLRKAVSSKDELVAYWREVRGKTLRYLESLSDEDLKLVPEKSLHPPGPNRDNPVREWFLMTIQHQNHNWGRLCVVQKLVEDRRKK